jgi:hypothetical protein
MEKYIFTFEDGTHYVSDSYNEDDFRAVCNGLLTIIRCSDAKELTSEKKWRELKNWRG